MDALQASTASAPAISGIASRFMLDMDTYAKGGELGFAGIDFYYTGRGGPLGDVDASVVHAAFGFFPEASVRANWEQGRTVTTPAKASAAFLACAHAWGEARFTDDLEPGRMAELASRVVEAADGAAAPLFAATRRVPRPTSDAARAIHELNLLRELRGAVHLAAVLTQGLAPGEALAIKTPGMAPMFGYDELPDVAGLEDRWQAAEDATDVAFARHLLVLSDDERAEFVGLVTAADAATA